MSAAVTSVPRPYWTTNTGTPLNGGLVSTYAAGTLTPKTFYSDEAKTVPVSNPIVINAAGRAQASSTDATEVNLYFTGSAKFIVKDALGNTLWTADNIEEVAVASASSTLAFPVTVTGGVSGGIPGFTSTTTLAASALLAQHAPVIGGGAGATPTTITAGTNNQILAGATGADPSFRVMTLADLPIFSARLTSSVLATTATLATLSDLSLTVPSATNYSYRLVLFMGGDTTGGVKIGLAGTAVVSSLRMNVLIWNESSAGSPLVSVVFSNTTLASNSTSASGSGTNNCCAIIDGSIAVTTGGTILIQFAQSTGSGTSSAVAASYIQLIPTSN